VSTARTAGARASAGGGSPARGGRRRRANLTVAALVAGAAVGGALSGAHPAGTPGLDNLYAAAWAALITLAASRASRESLLLLSGAAVAFSRSWMWAPAGAALAAAFASSLQRRPRVRLGALAGALASQALLRWPPLGFHGLTALLAAAAAAPVILTGWQNSRRRTRRIALWAAGSLAGLAVLLSAPALISDLLGRGPASDGVALASSALHNMEKGHSTTARGELATAAEDLTDARGLFGGWWDATAYAVPGVAEQQRALADGTRSGATLAEAAERDSRGLDLQGLRYAGGRIDLGAVEALQAPVARLDAAIGTAQAQLRATPRQWLLPPISSKLTHLGADLTRAGKATGLAETVLRAAPGLLGGNGVRRYFVAFMTPAEARGLGGFIGAYGILTADAGSLKLTASGQATALTASAPPGLRLPGPASYAARYGRFDPQDHFEDVTYSPDLPTVEQVVAGLYPEVGGAHIDGVLVLDPYALGALLRLTGPIPVPGLAGQLTSANAAQVLLRTQYLTGSVSNHQRHDLLQAALRAGFTRLTTGTLPSPKAIASALAPEVHQGRLMFWSSHPSAQRLAEKLGLSGAFPRPAGGDLLAVTLDNSANSKIDAYLHQHVADQVSYDPGSGQVASKVTISLRNDAPGSGMPLYVIGSFAGSGLPPGTSYLWVTIYSPLALSKVWVDGQPASFSGPLAENGVWAYSGYVTIGPGATTTVTALLAGRVAPGSYRLVTRLQPLANPQTFTVSVRPTAGWALRGPATWTAGTDMVQSHAWALSKR